MRESTRKERQAVKTLRKNQSDLEANRARCVTQRKAIAPRNQNEACIKQAEVDATDAGAMAAQARNLATYIGHQWAYVRHPDGSLRKPPT
jgi:hypothetical protein